MKQVQRKQPTFNILYILSAVFLVSMYVFVSDTFNTILILKFLSFPIAILSLILLIILLFLYGKKDKGNKTKESKKEIEAKSTFLQWVYVHSYYGRMSENPFIAGFNTVYKERTYRPFFVTLSIVCIIGGLLTAVGNYVARETITFPLSVMVAIIGFLILISFYLYYKFKIRS